MKTKLLPITALAMVGVLAGCGANPAAPDASTDSASDATIRWAIATGEPPISFTDENGQAVGMDPEIITAVVKQMGRDVELVPDSFQNSLLGVDAKRLDAASGASITPERIEKYDMVSYSIGSYGLAVKAEAAEIGTSMDDLCGLTLAMNAGDVMIPMLQDLSVECLADGAEAIEIAEFPDATAASLAVESNRADAWVGATISLGYAVNLEESKWKLSGPEWGQTTIGFVFLKGTGLAEEVAEALNGLIKDGTYAEIMGSLGLEGNMVTEAVVNPEATLGTR